MAKCGSEKAVNWIARPCNMVFESSVVSDDWRASVTVSLYKGKGGMTECKNYRGISLSKRSWRNIC